MDDLTDPVGLVWDDLEDRIKGLPLFQQNRVQFYTADDFVSATKEMKLPAVAVIYSGATPRDGGRPGAGSLSVTLQFGVYVIGTLSRKDAVGVTSITKQIIDEIKTAKSPVGHSYTFGGEFPFDTGIGVGFVHYWNTTAQFTN